jgi:toxin HigB-1
MSYTIAYSESYLVRAKAFFKKHPDVIKRYEKTLILLAANPFHPSLRLHRLKGNLKDAYSISINMQYRIIIDFVMKDKKIILANIGTHDEAYH